MRKKIYVVSLLVALMLGLVAFISGSAGHRAAASASNSALSALPASDIVITIDTGRLLSETLPTVLADNSGMLAKVNDKIERLNQETGIDARTFDSVAVGLRFKSRTDDFDAVVIARGHFNADSVIDAGLAAGEKKGEIQKRSEQYEGKTIFLAVPRRRVDVDVRVNRSEEKVAVSPERSSGTAVLSSKPVPGDDDPSRQEKEANNLSNQTAIVALDGNTIAVGNLKSVRAAIDASMGRERVDDELVRMATQNASALIGFSGRIPSSVTERMAAANRGGESKYFASIREFYGSFSTTGTDAESLVAVRTENATQAHDISQALNAMKMLSGFSAAQPGNGEINAFAEILKGLSITAQDNEVQIKLNVRQKDLAPLVREFK